MTNTALPARPPPRVDDRPLASVSPLVRSPFRLTLICLLLIVSAVAWRKGTYYSGGADSVVLGKAALSMVALFLAITAPRRGAAWSDLRVGLVPWLGLYLTIGSIGALLHGSGSSSIVLAVRISVMATTLVLLFRCYPRHQVLSALTTAMALLAAFAAATGIGSLAAEGRLYGGIPPLNANEIALLMSVPLVCLVWRCVHRMATTREVLAIPLLLGIVFLTGTRTGLAALLLAMAVVVMMAPRIPFPAFGLGIMTIPTLIYVAYFTPVLEGYATRGDTASVLTLNSRTVAWRAALDYPDGMTERMFGVGMSVKKIPVSAMYRNEQILDSTWISAVVQTGVLGVLVLAVLVIVTMLRAFVLAPPYRSLTVAVLLMILIVSFLESGLFDASVAFIAFFSFAFVAQETTGQRMGVEDSP
jgi:hypothetical protein